MRSSLKQIFFGKELSQEYICVPRSLPNAPRLFLVGTEEQDITKHHVLLGYKPLIFGSSLDLGAEMIQLEVRQEGAVLAKLGLNRIENTCGLFLYEGVSAKLNLSGKWRQFFLEQRERLKDKGPSNIDLSRSLFKQVVAAYCIPRSIPLMMVKKIGSVNIFPTDLHGGYGENSYTSSLRIDGKACAQLMEAEQILLCSMSLDRCKDVYNMGRNHMGEMRPIEEWPNLVETEFGTIPKGTIALKELKIVDHKDMGIHRVFSYNVKKEKTLAHNEAELAHCHREYIQWRLKNKFVSEYLLR